MKWDEFALPGVAEKMGVCIRTVLLGVGVVGIPVPVVGGLRDTMIWFMLLPVIVPGC